MLNYVSPACPSQVRSRDGATPLWIAAWAGRSEVVSALLRRGADVNTPRLLTRESPLWAACAGRDYEGAEEEDYVQTVKALVCEGGAQPHSRSTWGTSDAVAFAEAYTELGIAARQGRALVVEVLLDELGMDINTGSRSGASPLWLASRSACWRTCRLLCERGALVEKPLKGGDFKGTGPLWVACFYGHIGHMKVVAELLRYGAHIERAAAHRHAGKTPLQGKLSLRGKIWHLARTHARARTHTRSLVVLSLASPHRPRSSLCATGTTGKGGWRSCH